MKLQSCLMIRCIAINIINVQELLLKLKNYIDTYFPHTIIILVSNEQYWKYPECNSIVYNLSSNKIITVAEFIKNLPISWYRTEIDAEEDAIWNQNCHKGEVFLMPEVEWVNIYTWKGEERPTIN